MNILHTILLVTVLSTTLTAQENFLSGIVVDDETGAPVKDANIFLLFAKTGTTTDDDGYFKLSFLSGVRNDTLVVSYLGYLSLRLPLNEYRNNSLLRLTPMVFQMEKSIEVTAEKINLIKQDIPHAMHVIKMDEIERMGSSEISDLFKAIPAVRIEGNDLDGRTIQIRGSNADEVNVYIDGILINNLRFDQVADLSVVPTESIEEMEILKGGNLILLGSGAFGGVVNITTRKKFEHSYAIKIKGGSFDTRYLLGEINIPLSQNWTINYFGQYNYSTPQIEFFPNEKYGEKSENKNITTEKQNHHLNISRIDPSGQLSSTFLGYFFDYNKPSWENNHNNYIWALSYKGKLFGITDLDLISNFARADDKIQRSPANDYIYDSRYISDRLNLRMAKRFLLGATELQTLSEYFHDELQTSSKTREIKFYEAEVYENRAALAGVFTFKDTVRTQKAIVWNTSLGFRGDFLANGRKDFTYSAGLQIDIPSDRWHIKPYGHYGKNVKYATLVENAFIRDLTDFFRDDSQSTRLKPEYNNNGEVGIELEYAPPHQAYRSIDISLSLFNSTFYNKLLTRPFDNLISQAQIGRNVTKGIETSFRINQFWQDFTFLTSFFALDISDPFLYPFKPDMNFTTQLDYFPASGLYFRAVYFYEGNSTAWYYNVDDEFQTDKIPGFFDCDMTVGYKIGLGHLTVDLQVAGYNILDNSSYRYYTLKKRFVQAALTIRY